MLNRHVQVYYLCDVPPDGHIYSYIGIQAALAFGPEVNWDVQICVCTQSAS